MTLYRHSIGRGQIIGRGMMPHLSQSPPTFSLQTKTKFPWKAWTLLGQVLHMPWALGGGTTARQHNLPDVDVFTLRQVLI